MALLYFRTQYTFPCIFLPVPTGTYQWCFLHYPTHTLNNTDLTLTMPVLFYMMQCPYSYCPITPPLPKTGKHNWFLARSDDGKRLMIIRTHEPEKLYCKKPTVYKHREIREYPDSGYYVYEQDTSLLGPSGFLSWRRVNSLGSHCLFLGLDYPINQEITVGKDLDGIEALFAMENCVYMVSPRSSGANSPDCQRYSLQPK